MFFFIGGVQPKTVILTKQTRVCPHCGHAEICQKRVDANTGQNVLKIAYF